jgi:hypothetical protein
MTVNKKKQKDLIINIMRDDQRLGLYREKNTSPEVYNHNEDYNESQLSIRGKILSWLVYSLVMIVLVYLLLSIGWR